ncbi:fluoride efflux transporter CrcB [Aliikangiella sp. IMCC44653]
MLKIAPLLMLALGGALGAVARYAIKQLLPLISSSSFPLSTLIVNTSGCFAAGLVYTWLENSGTHWDTSKQLFFFAGFLGAFTTFSAFALESLVLFNQGQSWRLGLNILLNCLLCLICVFFGAWVGGRIAAN